MRGKRSALVLAAAAAMALGVALPAQAAGGITLADRATGLCLDGGKGSEIYTTGCTPGNNNQIWDVRPVAGGDNWVNRGTGLCLWMGNGVVQGVEAGLGCPQNFAKWISKGDGMWSTVDDSGNCLDSNAAGEVYGRGCDAGNTFQKWNSGAA